MSVRGLTLAHWHEDLRSVPRSSNYSRVNIRTHRLKVVKQVGVWSWYRTRFTIFSIDEWLTSLGVEGVGTGVSCILCSKKHKPILLSSHFCWQASLDPLRTGKAENIPACFQQVHWALWTGMSLLLHNSQLRDDGACVRTFGREKLSADNSPGGLTGGQRGGKSWSIYLAGLCHSCGMKSGPLPRERGTSLN